MVLDLLALVGSGALAYYVWALPIHAQPVQMYSQLIPLLGLFIIGYALFGLYPGSGLGGVEILRRLTLVTLFCFFFLAAAAFGLKIPHLYSRMTYGIAAVLSLIAVPFVRYNGLHRARRWRWWQKPVVLVAEACEASGAAELFERSDGSDYRAVAFLELGSRTLRGEVGGVPVLGDLSQASAVAEKGISTAVVVSTGSVRAGLPDDLRRHFRHVMVVSSYSEVATERLSVRNLGRTLGVEYTNNLLVPGNRFLKRSLDIIVGTLTLVLSMPALALAMTVAWLTSPGPALYYQDRMGFRGARFRMPKVRTMLENADIQLRDRLKSDDDLRRDWEDGFKLKNDPRVVPYVGSILRRLSLDELPQLVSVIRGEMSLVGPRPLPDYHWKALSERGRELRSEVRPGITGLWQVSGRSSSSSGEIESQDEYYIKNWTIWLDLYVLGKTVGAVISGRGAY